MEENARKYLLQQISKAKEAISNIELLLDKDKFKAVMEGIKNG